MDEINCDFPELTSYVQSDGDLGDEGAASVIQVMKKEPRAIIGIDQEYGPLGSFSRRPLSKSPAGSYDPDALEDASAWEYGYVRAECPGAPVYGDWEAIRKKLSSSRLVYAYVYSTLTERK